MGAALQEALEAAVHFVTRNAVPEQDQGQVKTLSCRHSAGVQDPIQCSLLLEHNGKAKGLKEPEELE